MISINRLRKIRLEKLEKIKKLGLNPYPARANQKQVIIQALKMMGKSVSVVGRIMAIREHGGIVFFDLRDESGKIQLVFKEDELQTTDYQLLALLDLGDFIDAQGKIFKTRAGEISVLVKDFHLLTKALRPLPSKWYGLKEVEERYRQRYLDLLFNQEVREVFKTRAKVVQLLRKYLDERGFLEVKTPALQPIYGGASAEPFITHHRALDLDLYLRIADELYLKRLMVGGFERVYELCTDFRNEGIDRWHNPEFSMLEFYWAYADYKDLMKMTEEMLSSIVKEVKGSTRINYGGQKVDFKMPWKRISYQEAILKETGIDIDRENTVKKLKKAIKEKKNQVDLKRVSDFPSLLDALYKATVKPKIANPIFLIDHPIVMRPLAKRHWKKPSRVESFQLIVAGAELINAYSELNDPQEQRSRWEEDMQRAKAGVKEFQVIDEDYLRALEYGMPPVAGWGMGVDRLLAILTNQHSLKDTILFPTLRPRKIHRNPLSL